MSETLDTLLSELFGRTTQPLAAQCAAWLQSSRRFRTFAEAYRHKIRKKVSAIQNEEARRDLACELETAYLLLRAREFVVEYERYTQFKQRGPDFTIIYRTHTPLNVEVKRLRTTSQDATPDERSIEGKLLNSICDKLGQMPPSVINVLTFVADGVPYVDADIGIAMNILNERATLRDDEFFAHRGFLGSRDFQKQSQRLSAIMLRSRANHAPSYPAVLWLNPNAKHPLTREITTLLLRCLTPQ
jgi:hypothetical protein